MKKLRKIIFNYWLFSLIAILVAFWDLVFLQKSMKWDILDQFLPCRIFIDESFSAGFIPLWCPYINLGYPFFADPQGGLFYFPVWLVSFVFKYDIAVIQWEFLVHVLIASAGFYKLSGTLFHERKVAVLLSILFSLSGVFISNAQHLTWIIAIAWLVWSAYFLYQLMHTLQWKYSLGFSLTFSLAFSGGYPAFSFVAVYLFMFFVLYHLVLNFSDKFFFKRQIGLLILTAFWGLLFNLGYLLSLWNVNAEMARIGGVSLSQANYNPFTFSSYISFFFPYCVSSNSTFFQTDISMANAYIGFFAILFVLFFSVIQFHKKVNFNLILAALFLLIAAGDLLPFRTWVYHFFPLMNLFRQAALFRLFGLFFLLIALGFAFSAFFSSKTDKNIFQFLVFASFVLLLSLSLQKLGWLLPITFDSVFFFQWKVHLVLLITLFLVYFKFRHNKEIVSTLFVFIMSLDVIIGARLNSSATVTSNFSVKKVQSTLDSLHQSFSSFSNKNISAISSTSDGSTDPLWRNLSIYKKEVANDGWNNFHLAAYDRLDTMASKWKILNHPVLYANDTTVQFYSYNFLPNKISVIYIAKRASTLHFMQLYANGWKALLDREEVTIDKIDEFISLKIPSGKHQVEIYYDKVNFIYLILMQITFQLLASIALICFYIKRKLKIT